ncbi:MAG: hypothetical protein M3Q30_23965, partial [Actinomycetota bacterium]|nr:hypothetical protein [Actinomycetota bacterium]
MKRWVRMLGVALVFLAACTGADIKQYNPTPTLGPGDLLLEATMSRMKAVDPDEWKELRFFGISASNDGRTANISISSDLGYDDIDWNEGVLPALAWFVGKFVEDSDFGDKLTFTAAAPGWNIEDQTFPGQTWTWARSALGPYL